MSKGTVESDEAFDARYEAFFNRRDIDGWECRKVFISTACCLIQC